jgi:CreA protein
VVAVMVTTVIELQRSEGTLPCYQMTKQLDRRSLSVTSHSPTACRKTALLAGVLFLAAALPAGAQERIGAVSTTFRVIGPNDKVVVDRYDDPKVENAACYVSRAETGGISGAVGLAEDPSRFSIACRAVGPLKITGDIDKTERGELVFSERTSAIFKSMRVTRFYDKTKNVLVYLITSTKVVEGSPFNSISVVPLAQ